MGSVAAEVVPVEISSDEEDDVKMPNAAAAGKRKFPESALDWAEKMLAEDDFGVGGEDMVDPAEVQELLESLMDAMGDTESAAGDKNAVPDAHGDDDDCIILDGDPDKPVAVVKEEGSRRDATEDELQIVAEKGELACRDFPHPRHLCATLLFSTSSHASHCSMCHCYVCDSPAPCAFWGNGTTRTDHCHATDKDAKWKKLRQSSKNKNQPLPKRRSIPSAMGPSSQSSANVNGSTGGYPLSTVQGQNHLVRPAYLDQWNTMQGISQMTATSPMSRVTIASRGSKSARVATPDYTPSNANHLRPSVPLNVSMQPARAHAFQTTQVPPGGRVSAGTSQTNRPQLRSGAPIGSQGYQYRPASYPQPAPNMVDGTGVPLSRYTSVATMGTQCPQVPLADGRLKEKEALASLALELGVPDYYTNQPQGQQTASTSQSLQSSQLLAQAKAGQRIQVKKNSYAAATSQMRPSSGHNLSNQASGSTVLSSGSVQIQQPLCQLNSQSSLTLCGTAPSTLLDGK
ncbi:unnamed protein product [Urochloa humidicola]